MKVSLLNHWRNRISTGYAYITCFNVRWQFDEYYKGVGITIFNFEINFDKFTEPK